MKGKGSITRHSANLRPNFRRGWRIAFWNTLLILAALALIMTIGEVYLRLTKPFIRSSVVLDFVPEVGLLYKPNTVLYATNGVEFWVKSRVNSIGFLEREYRNLKQTEEGCHIAFIGDSFVVAREVKLADRFSVVAEALAEDSLPEMNITTSAFGRGSSGQIHQIPFYDRYVRKMNPDLLVLVFAANDFLDNSSLLYYLHSATPWHPDHPPNAYALKSEDGTISLYPPDPDFREHSIIFPRKNSIISQIEILPNTFFGSWLSSRLASVPSSLLTQHIPRSGRLVERANILQDRPGYAALMADWKPFNWRKLFDSFEENNPINVLQDALDFTGFSLDQFKERADRDGASLAILATESLSVSTLRLGLRKRIEGRAPIDSLQEMAIARGIPVIDMYNYLLRQGGRVEDRISGMRFEHDPHWNEIGHRLAAEAVLEYLKENRWICGTPEAGEPVP